MKLHLFHQPLRNACDCERNHKKDSVGTRLQGNAYSIDTQKNAPVSIPLKDKRQSADAYHLVHDEWHFPIKSMRAQHARQCKSSHNSTIVYVQVHHRLFQYRLNKSWACTTNPWDALLQHTTQGLTGFVNR